MIPHHSVRQLGQQFFCRFCLGSLMWLPLAGGLTNSGVSWGSQPGWVPCSISMWLTWAFSQHGDLKAVVEEAKPVSAFVMFANVPLAKANHMAQPRVNVGGDCPEQKYTKRRLTGGHLYLILQFCHKNH